MIAFEQLEARPQGDLPYVCFDRWLTSDGEGSVLFHRTDCGYLLRFLGRADFDIDLSLRRVTCIPMPDVVDETLADLHFNQVLPLIMGYDGDLVLHASAVEIGGGAVAFLGATGRGKSTMAASLARAGCPFLTDDGLILERRGEGYAVRPRRPILRLRPDSEAALLGFTGLDLAEAEAAEGFQLKSRVSAGPAIPFCEEEVPLQAIYVLLDPQDCGEVDIHALPQSARLPALLSHSFLLDVEDRKRMRSHFDRLADLAGHAPIYSLDYPRDYKALPSVVKTIIGHVESGGKSL